MRKLRRTILALLGIPALVACIALFRIYLLYGNVDPNTLLSLAIGSDPITMRSPDSEYNLTAEVWRRYDDKNAYLSVILKIFDKSGNFLQEINTHASDVHKWEVEWQSNQNILFRSSDIGACEYVKQPDGWWKSSISHLNENESQPGDAFEPRGSSRQVIPVFR